MTQACPAPSCFSAGLLRYAGHPPKRVCRPANYAERCTVFELSSSMMQAENDSLIGFILNNIFGEDAVEQPKRQLNELQALLAALEVLDIDSIEPTYFQTLVQLCKARLNEIESFVYKN